jgi:hypothetical protein
VIGCIVSSAAAAENLPGSFGRETRPLSVQCSARFEGPGSLPGPSCFLSWLLRAAALVHASGQRGPMGGGPDLPPWPGQPRPIRPAPGPCLRRGPDHHLHRPGLLFRHMLRGPGVLLALRSYPRPGLLPGPGPGVPQSTGSPPQVIHTLAVPPGPPKCDLLAFGCPDHLKTPSKTSYHDDDGYYETLLPRNIMAFFSARSLCQCVPDRSQQRIAAARPREALMEKAGSPWHMESGIWRMDTSAPRGEDQVSMDTSTRLGVQA